MGELLRVSNQPSGSGHDDSSNVVVGNAIRKSGVTRVGAAHLRDDLRVTPGEGNQICIGAPTEKISDSLTGDRSHRQIVMPVSLITASGLSGFAS